ncbi:MAG: FAD-binding oxidoreductase [Alphaproteobacteria bacterium]
MTGYMLRHDAMSWGRVARTPQRVASPRFVDDLPALVAARPDGTVLPVGRRRSYGDSALNSGGGLIAMTGLDRFIAIDAKAGTLRAEAGITLAEIARRTVPLGFFVPVMPGTGFVTLGGAIANDVHGKNHHRAGTFGRHVLRLGLLRGDGARIEAGPDMNADLFAATVGGLGLTGVIEWAEIGLPPIPSGWLDVERLAFDNLDAFWPLAEASVASHENTVSWIDATANGRRAGRGIFFRANWRHDAEPVDEGAARVRVPFEAPNWLLNGVTTGAFNRLYDIVQKRKASPRRESFATFFNPLDGIADWNRLYGRHGLWQYQCVVPPAAMKHATAALLREIVHGGLGSVLAVLKTFGAIASPGLLSFPMEGATLTLDFPNRGEDVLRLFSRFDAVVREAGGRLYAAKDGRVPKEMWAAGYPELARFARHVDPAFASDFWRRVAP